MTTEYTLELRHGGALLAHMQGPYAELASTALSLYGISRYVRVGGKELWTNNLGHSLVLFRKEM